MGAGFALDPFVVASCNLPASSGALLPFCWNESTGGCLSFTGSVCKQHLASVVAELVVLLSIIGQASSGKPQIGKAQLMCPLLCRCIVWVIVASLLFIRSQVVPSFVI